MSFSRVINLNAIINIALGIAFGLYAPLVLAAFGIPDDPSGDSLLYWYAASFARLFGATMVGFGLLMFSIHKVVDNKVYPEILRGILYTLIISSIIGFITCLTQQVVVWQHPLGWVITGYYLVFVAVYFYFVVRLSRDKTGP